MKHNWLTGITAGLVGAVVAVTMAGPAHAAAQPRYVALGDSYASGLGAGSYLDTTCYRSLKSYSGLIASTYGFALNMQACSGATTSDVTNRQLATLDTTTAYVTITVGGNDIGFADTMTTCLGRNQSACLSAVQAAVGVATTTLPDRLLTLFTAIEGKAPNARIVATNYPRLFNGRDCSLLTDFTTTEMTALNNGSDTLSGVIKDAAAGSGIGFVDVRTPFTGHAICDSKAWINNASLFTSAASFHPNATGQASGYKPSVASALTAGGVSSTSATMTVTTGGVTSSDTKRGQVKIRANN